MTPEYIYYIKADLKSDDEAQSLKNSFNNFRGVEEVALLQPSESTAKPISTTTELLDLVALGQLLETKRKELGIPKTVLARKARIDRGTVWVTERGNNPKTGRPSRISETKLERWMTVLQIGKAEQQDILKRSGYNPSLNSNS